MVLGHPILERVIKLRLVPEIPFLSSSHPSLHPTSPPSCPRCRMWQLRSLSLSLSLSHDPYDLLSILIYNVLKDFFFLIVNF